jgi:hypothetical protein
MTDSPTSGLTADTSVAGTDRLYISQDAGGGTFTSKYVTAANLAAGLGPLGLGAAQATSIQFGAGSALSRFTDVTTWTPTDSSGAGLALTVTRAKYSVVGNLVFVQLSIVYPTTASGSNALIGGLPLSVAVSGDSTAPLICNSTIAGNAQFLANTATLHFVDFSGNAFTNANLSGKTVIFSGVYFQT